MCRLSRNLGSSTSWNNQGLTRPIMVLLYIYPLMMGLDTPVTYRGWRNIRVQRITCASSCFSLDDYIEKYGKKNIKLDPVVFVSKHIVSYQRQIRKQFAWKQREDGGTGSVFLWAQQTYVTNFNVSVLTKTWSFVDNSTAWLHIGPKFFETSARFWWWNARSHSWYMYQAPDKFQPQ